MINQKKKVPITIRILMYLFVGTVLSILVFFSTSFISYLIDLDTFNVYASDRKFDVDVGFPFTYYEEKYIDYNYYPSTSTNIGSLLLDCTITWCLVAFPYFLFKLRKMRTKRHYKTSQIIDQSEF